MTGTGLVLFAKRPENSKRRLVPEIGSRAGELAERLFDCAYEDLCGWSGPAWIAAGSEEDAVWLRARAPQTAILVQPPGTLGRRLMAIDAQLRAQGAQRLLSIGSDCPAMTQSYLEQAQERLDRADAVFGAARDGGVCIMGARRPWPDIEDLPWSDAALGWALNERCLTHGFSTAHLPALDDIDTLADVRGLGEALQGDARPARASLASWLRASGFDG